MGTVLYFLVLAGVFFLMMRFGCGSHVMGHGHGGHEEQASGKDRESAGLHWLPPETDIDPVSHVSLRTESAKSSVYRGTVYYFSSEENRARFEADPERYVGAGAGAEAKSAEHHHG